MTEESEAAKQAHKDGLEYASFGRWKDPKTGKVVAFSHGGKLTYSSASDANEGDVSFDELHIPELVGNKHVEGGADKKITQSINHTFQSLVDHDHEDQSHGAVSGRIDDAEEELNASLAKHEEAITARLRKINGMIHSTTDSARKKSLETVHDQFSEVGQALHGSFTEIEHLAATAREELNDREHNMQDGVDPMLDESEASDEAKADGLEYASFGRWKDPKTGKVVAQSHGGKLTYNDADQEADDHTFEKGLNGIDPHELVRSGASAKDLETSFISRATESFEETVHEEGASAAHSRVRDQLDAVYTKVDTTRKKIEAKIMANQNSGSTSSNIGGYKELMNRYNRVADAISIAHEELDGEYETHSAREADEQESESKYDRMEQDHIDAQSEKQFADQDKVDAWEKKNLPKISNGDDAPTGYDARVAHASRFDDDQPEELTGYDKRVADASKHDGPSNDEGRMWDEDDYRDNDIY